MAMEACDSLLMIGTSFPYLDHYPRPGQARAVQIDRDPGRIGLRYPIEVGLAGDARETLRALLPPLTRRDDRSSLEFACRGQIGQGTGRRPLHVAEVLQLALRQARRARQGVFVKKSASSRRALPAAAVFLTAAFGLGLLWRRRWLRR
jgi:Thiamine pyrophosphate enzyme, central domain